MEPGTEAAGALLIKAGRRIHPVEITPGTTVGVQDVSGLRNCMMDLGLKRGMVIASTAERRRLNAAVEILPWGEVRIGKLEL